MLRFALLLLVCAALSACASPADLTLAEPLPIDGLYRSTAAVGDLGQLQLVVRKRTKAIRVFEAQLTSNLAEVEESPGVGTLGNQHLVLNFDLGATDDF